MTESSISDIRPYPLDEHPLCTQDYILPTDSISYAWECLDKALRRRAGGFIIWGYSRVGKSKAINYLAIEAQAKYKGLFVSSVDGEVKTYVSERDFFSRLCESLGLKTTGAGGECRRRAITAMQDRGARNQKRLFLLFIDEPQKWGELQLQWVCEIYDRLEEHNVRLVAVLVGQPELTGFRKNYIDRGRTVIINRLMNDAIQFSGIKNQNQLAYVLKGYDTLLDDIASWPFTRFFLPKAFAGGFRLEQFSELIWNGFSAVFDENGKFVDYWIPMLHIATMVELLFTEYHSLDAPDFVIGRELVDELIYEVKFAQYLKSIEASVVRQVDGWG